MSCQMVGEGVIVTVERHRPYIGAGGRNNGLSMCVSGKRLTELRTAIGSQASIHVYVVWRTVFMAMIMFEL